MLCTPLCPGDPQEDSRHAVAMPLGLDPVDFNDVTASRHRKPGWHARARKVRRAGEMESETIQPLIVTLCIPPASKHRIDVPPPRTVSSERMLAISCWLEHPCGTTALDSLCGLLVLMDTTSPSSLLLIERSASVT